LAFQLTGFGRKAVPQNGKPAESNKKQASNERAIPQIRRGERMFRRRPAPVVMLPYVDPRGHQTVVRWARRLLPPVFVILCFSWGVGFAFFAPHLIPFFAAPLVVLAGLVIWSLPDSRSVPVRSMTVLFWVFMAGLELWPNYLALALPGLPWITMVRLSGIPLCVLMLVCVSASPRFRSGLSASLKASRLMTGLLVAFTILEALSVFWSSNRLESLNRLFVNATSCTSVYFIAAYLFRAPGRIERWAAFMWIMASLLCLEGMVEWRLGHTLWAGHIPRFLAMAQGDVAEVLSNGYVRVGTGAYRVQATASTALGLAEFLALSMPFVLHFATTSTYRLAVRLAAIATIPMIFVVISYTDSRLGMIGAGLAVLGYPFCLALLSWRRERESLLSPALVLGYPALFTLAVAGSLFIGRVRHKILGDGSQQSSNDARATQWHMGVPKILSHPWGYGLGNGGGVLGYYNPGGQLTIDTYYLNEMLDVGILGFLLFFAIIVVGGLQSANLALRDSYRDRDYRFLVPITISLGIFFIIKSVFAQQDNHPLIFMMLGAIAALASRANDDQAAENTPVNPVDKGMFAKPS
jgi:hypothetical protein